ncbi:HpcH/HpaI aldolase family protein [Histidinibacterium lentulum]|uniref:4-hydroxy-2-oxo-heptane-1,7-dioate aldolase n=1 Tax=Histidinibacterium lentulum TaxID=2480588 RepID=A0A3N2R8H5_9RHOB|nr:aldolase/citrate lyase family protein [Histidinibacterium lentulum]ROU03782.1 4-hydroxy-2-oxo-heptane-1,7-dioate aldolase [Histidinibacterium lentulum]
MSLPRNMFKAALSEGRTQLGYWCSIDDSAATEMAAGCGYDWLLIDCEHTAMDPRSVLSHLQAVAPYPTQAVVRPSSLDAAEIKKLLDLGAQSLIVPYVRDAQEAREAAEAVDYAPGGIRGVAGLTRASRFGRVQGYAGRAREEICLIVQIETVSALDDLEAILAVPGVDGAFVGPADLAASMGYPGEPDRPEVRTAALEAIRRIRAAGKPAGFLTLDEGGMAEAVAAGCNFPAVAVDAALLRQGAEATLARWRAKVG